MGAFYCSVHMLAVRVSSSDLIPIITVTMNNHHVPKHVVESASEDEIFSHL